MSSSLTHLLYPQSLSSTMLLLAHSHSSPPPLLIPQSIKLLLHPPGPASSFQPLFTPPYYILCPQLPSSTFLSLFFRILAHPCTVHTHVQLLYSCYPLFLSSGTARLGGVFKWMSRFKSLNVLGQFIQDDSVRDDESVDHKQSCE